MGLDPLTIGDVDLAVGDSADCFCELGFPDYAVIVAVVAAQDALGFVVFRFFESDCVQVLEQHASGVRFAGILLIRVGQSS